MTYPLIIRLHELTRIKQKNPAELINEAEKLELKIQVHENRKSYLILKTCWKWANNRGVLEVLQDGFRFFASYSQAIFPAGWYMSPKIRRFGLRTEASWEIRARMPSDTCLLKVNKINFDDMKRKK